MRETAPRNDARTAYAILQVVNPFRACRRIERGALHAYSGLALEIMKTLSCLALAACLLAAGCAGNAVDPIPQEGAMTKRITWVVAENPNEECGRVGRPLLMYGKTLGCADWK